VPPIDVVSVYGPTNAGVRARALRWCSRFGIVPRLTNYFPGNAAAGGEFLRRPLRAAAAEGRLRSLMRRQPEILLLSREASPLSKGTIEARLLTRSAHGVYDIDDALHEDVRGRSFEALFSKSAKASRAALAADVVIAGNDFLADWARTSADEIRVIPTCVEPNDYNQKQDYTLSDPPRLVWLGTPSGEPYLADVAPALLRANRATGARLSIIGSGSRDLGSLEPIVDRIPWRLSWVHEHLRSFDVGLMPLRDSQYEKGKCAYKLLEYGAAGLPFVGSPVGVNASILEGADAPAPQSLDDWVDAVGACLSAAAEDRRDQARRQAIIIGRFTYEHWADAWREAVLV
jgi:glycosyltransferase involved in cell wall biosynthesis